MKVRGQNRFMVSADELISLRQIVCAEKRALFIQKWRQKSVRRQNQCRARRAVTGTPEPDRRAEEKNALHMTPQSSAVLPGRAAQFHPAARRYNATDAGEWFVNNALRRDLRWTRYSAKKLRDGEPHAYVLRDFPLLYAQYE